MLETRGQCAYQAVSSFYCKVAPQPCTVLICVLYEQTNIPMNGSSFCGPYGCITNKKKKKNIFFVPPPPSSYITFFLHAFFWADQLKRCRACVNPIPSFTPREHAGKLQQILLDDCSLAVSHRKYQLDHAEEEQIEVQEEGSQR